MRTVFTAFSLVIAFASHVQASSFSFSESFNVEILGLTSSKLNGPFGEAESIPLSVRIQGTVDTSTLTANVTVSAIGNPAPLPPVALDIEASFDYMFDPDGFDPPFSGSADLTFSVVGDRAFTIMQPSNPLMIDGGTLLSEQFIFGQVEVSNFALLGGITGGPLTTLRSFSANGEVGCLVCDAVVSLQLTDVPAPAFADFDFRTQAGVNLVESRELLFVEPGVQVSVNDIRLALGFGPGTLQVTGDRPSWRLGAGTAPFVAPEPPPVPALDRWSALLLALGLLGSAAWALSRARAGHVK